MAVNNIVVTIIALSVASSSVPATPCGDIRAGPFEGSGLASCQPPAVPYVAYTRAQRALWLCSFCLLFFFFFKSLDRFIAVDPMTDASPFAPKGSQPDDLKLPVAKEGCG